MRDPELDALMHQLEELRGIEEAHDPDMSYGGMSAQALSTAISALKTDHAYFNGSFEEP